MMSSKQKIGRVGAPFRLVRYFSMASLVAIAIVTALLGMFYRRVALNNLMELAESRNVALTLAFANSLWPEFAPFVASASGLSGDELRARPEIARLRQAVLQQMTGLEVAKVKVYNLAGLTVFSTEEKQIGEDKSNNPGFLSARSGKLVSDLVHRDAFNAFDRVIENRDLIQTYLPIRYEGPAGPIEGVFELYYDVTPFLQKMALTQRVVVIGVLLIFTLLYGVLFIVVRRADRIIKRQDHALQQYLDELREANETLEQSVERRTRELLKVNEKLENEVTEHRQAEEEAERRAREQEALNAIAKATSQSLRLDEILQIALDKVREVTGRQRVNIRLKDPATGEVQLRAYLGFSPEEIEDLRRRTPHRMSDQVFASGEPLVIHDAKEVSPGTLLERSRSVAWIPIRTGAKVVGVFGISDDGSVTFSKGEIDLLLAIGNVIAVALENARLFQESERLFQETQRNLQRMRALQEIEQAITSTLDLHTLLDVLLEKIDFLLPYAAATVRLFNKESRLLEPVACRNLNQEEWRAQPWRGGRGLANVVFEAQTPTVIRNTLTDMRVRDHEFYRRHRLISFLGIPLTVKEETLGVISFYTREEHEFSKDEIEFLGSVARQAAIAIYNSQLYEQTKRQAAELEKANKVKDEFLGFVSHELRTPVNAVIGYTGMVKERILGEINPQQESTLGKVIKRSEELLGMINTLLEAARIEAGAAKTNREEFRLRGFLDELKSTYDVLLDKELTLVWDYPSDLPAVTTDREKLRHILQNLVNNAIKYTDKGDVTISARVRQQAEGNNRPQTVDRRRSSVEEKRPPPQASAAFVEFKVADAGMGIPKEFLPTIFEMFRQVDGPKAGRRSGVGLGLHIVKQFTELLGGKVEVESEPGKGSTFTVTLPV